MKRLPTLVPGLDTILNGGLFEGGVYILEGPPGVGKTTLANQIAHLHAQANHKTLYLTILAESHSRMLQHMQDQSFFRQDSVNAKVFYVSGYRDFEKKGLKGIVSLVHGELARTGASIFILDGFVSPNRSVDADDAMRPFVHELQSLVTAMKCTCLILTSGRGNALSAEQTMVDGIFGFEDVSFDWRAERRLQVHKFRGSYVIRGQHAFCITEDGIEVFPRLESLPARDVLAIGKPYLPTGLGELDRLLQGGGLLTGSSSAVIGKNGTGKTLFGLAFAAGGTPQAPGLLMSGFEEAADLLRLASGTPIGAVDAVKTGALFIDPLDVEDASLDQIGHRILHRVDSLNARRFVLDGLSTLTVTLAFKERGYRFVGRLIRELKRRRVTLVCTIDPNAVAVATDASFAEGVLGWFDNIFECGYQEGEGGVGSRRIIDVRKLKTAQLNPPQTSTRLRYEPLFKNEV